MPICPAVHLSFSKYFRLLLHFCIWLASCRISRVRWCLGFLSSESKALSAAWLSTATEQDVAPRFSVPIRCNASRSPTNSASYTVCSASGPRWKCKVLSGLFFLISIAAAPTLPFRAEPSVKPVKLKREVKRPSVLFPCSSLHALKPGLLMTETTFQRRLPMPILRSSIWISLEIKS